MATAYDVITERIVRQLEAGTAPWRKPWAAGGPPQSLVRRTAYRGINAFLLACAPYRSPYWLTYRQAQELGGHVRKGERGWPIVFWKWLEAKDAGDRAQDGGHDSERSGAEATGRRRVPLLRYYTGFNVEQCEGLPAGVVPPAEEALGPAFQPLERCEAVARDMPRPPAVRHGLAHAAYVPATDTVELPAPERFASAEYYYATLFHELTHATGHESRLARPGVAGGPAPFGSRTYSREELVAEMGAAFLCGHCGIGTAPP